MLLIGVAICLSILFIMLNLSIKNGYIPLRLQLTASLVLCVAITFFAYSLFKNKDKKEKIKRSLLVGVGVAFIGHAVMSYFYPSSKQALLSKAQDAEQNYYLLSTGSLDHGRICSAARQAQKLYSKLEDEEKVNMFNYILITDKCL